MLVSTHSRFSTCHVELAGPGPLRHLGPVQGDVLRGPEHAVVLDQDLAVDRVGQLGPVVRRPDPAPQHQVGTRRDRRCRVGLKHRQVADHLEHVIGPWLVEQLGGDSDPPRLRSGQFVNR